MDLDVFVKEWLDAWTTHGDPAAAERLLAYYDADAFYADPAVRKGLNGHTELKPYFTKLLAKNPEWVWTAEEIIPTVKGCTLKWRARIPVPDGGEIVESGLDILELSGGKILRNEVFFDRVAWLNALTS